MERRRGHTEHRRIEHQDELSVPRTPSCCPRPYFCDCLREASSATSCLMREKKRPLRGLFSCSLLEFKIVVSLWCGCSARAALRCGFLSSAFACCYGVGFRRGGGFFCGWACI